MNSCNEAALYQVNEYLVSGKVAKTNVKKISSCKNLKPRVNKSKSL